MPNTETTHVVAKNTAKHLAGIHFCDLPGVVPSGRIQITPVLPSRTSGGRNVGTPHDLVCPSITVAADRDPAAIAKAISSRLLKDALAAFEHAESYLADCQGTQDMIEAYVECIIENGHGTKGRTKEDVRLSLPDGTRGRFEVGLGDSHALEFKGLPMAKVLAILAIVRGK